MKAFNRIELAPQPYSELEESSEGTGLISKNDPNDRIVLSLDLVGPFAAQLGIGGVAGFIVGFAIRKLFKLLAVLTVLIFIFLQVLAWRGFIDIRYDRMYAAVAGMVQQTQTGITEFNLPVLITANIPLAGSFIAGLGLGFKIG